ncbi:MAG TPA: GNAT family N-acetyltransferase, partial [Myxococcales bacterium]|nr:GNAT family N-acetyltransferase [Myxococcales bacterium]
ADEVAAIYRPWVERSAVSAELEAPGREEMAGRIAASTPYAPWLVCEGPDGIWGYAYASKHRERAAYQWSVDVAVYVGEAHRKQGVGRALSAKLFRLLRLQGFHAAHAGITLPNAASVGLHESLGFRLIGVYPRVGYKMGAWHDVGWWQLELRERSGEPAPPKTTADAQRDPAWAEELAR